MQLNIIWFIKLAEPTDIKELGKVTQSIHLVVWLLRCLLVLRPELFSLFKGLDKGLLFKKIFIYLFARIGS